MKSKKTPTEISEKDVPRAALNGKIKELIIQEAREKDYLWCDLRRVIPGAGNTKCIAGLMYKLVFVTSIEYNFTAIMLLGLESNKLLAEEGCVNMTDHRIYELACIFKTAMLAAQDDGLFEGDEVFCSFPTGCCGPTCDLLAAFLKEYDIETIYVWGDYRDQSHAWLVVNDERVKHPTCRYIDVGDEYARLVNQYGGNVSGQIENTSYSARDLTDGLVIDITADQFGEPSVYVGERNDFYRKHKFRLAHICEGVNDAWLSGLYRNISWFLPK